MARMPPPHHHEHGRRARPSSRSCRPGAGPASGRSPRAVAPAGALRLPRGSAMRSATAPWRALAATNASRTKAVSNASTPSARRRRGVAAAAGSGGREVGGAARTVVVRSFPWPGRAGFLVHEPNSCSARRSTGVVEIGGDHLDQAGGHDGVIGEGVGDGRRPRRPAVGPRSAAARQRSAPVWMRPRGGRRSRAGGWRGRDAPAARRPRDRCRPRGRRSSPPRPRGGKSSSIATMRWRVESFRSLSTLW